MAKYFFFGRNALSSVSSLLFHLSHVNSYGAIAARKTISSAFHELCCWVVCSSNFSAAWWVFLWQDALLAPNYRTLECTGFSQGIIEKNVDCKLLQCCTMQISQLSSVVFMFLVTPAELEACYWHIHSLKMLLLLEFPTLRLGKCPAHMSYQIWCSPDKWWCQNNLLQVFWSVMVY